MKESNGRVTQLLEEDPQPGRCAWFHERGPRCNYYEGHGGPHDYRRLPEPPGPVAAPERPREEAVREFREVADAITEEIAQTLVERVERLEAQAGAAADNTTDVHLRICARLSALEAHVAEMRETKAEPNTRCSVATSGLHLFLGFSGNCYYCGTMAPAATRAPTDQDEGQR